MVNMVSTYQLLAILATLGSVCGDCISFFKEVGVNQVQKLMPPNPTTWDDLSFKCADSFPGYRLVMFQYNMTDAEKEYCRDELVPYGVKFVAEDSVGYFLDGSTLSLGHLPPTASQMRALDDTYPCPDVGVGVLNVSTGRWHLVEENLNFTCALCQREGVDMSYIKMLFNDENLAVNPAINFYHARLEQTKESSVVQVTEDDKVRLLSAIVDALHSINVTLAKFSKSWLDSDGKIVVEFLLKQEGYSEFNVLENFEDVTIEDMYHMVLEYAFDCPEEVVKGEDGSVAVWPSQNIGSVGILTNIETGVTTRRFCTPDYVAGQNSWGPSTFWERVMVPCSEDAQFANEDEYREVLGPEVEHRHRHLLDPFVNLTAVNVTVLQHVAALMSRKLLENGQIYEDYVTNIVQILAYSQIELSSENCVVSLPLIQLIITDRVMTHPVVGFKLVDPTGGTEEDNFHVDVELDRRQSGDTDPKEIVTLSLCDDFVGISDQMAFVILWKTISRKDSKDFFTPSLGNKDSEMYVLLKGKDLLKFSDFDLLDDDKFFVDITYTENTAHHTGHGDTMTVTCAAWNDALNDWTRTGCHTLKSSKNKRIVCRCRAKYMTRLKSGVLYGRYAMLNLHHDHRTVWVFLNDSIGLAIMTVLETVLSLFGFLAIILTLLRFKEWRENVGNKILVHMVMALSCSLLLGFVTSFLHLDTESTECLVIGIFRHYSFLAMFLWMQVLSGLQLKRLMTVAGARATSHLILKVSVFAWGFPWVPIIVVVAWDTRLYRWDRFDRGCYPEGLVFQLTVQAPAAVILLVNLGIFIKIVAHIFDLRCCGGDDEMKVTRHSKNERAEQLNRLKTSFFIFFLFGFTWVFHFLSEERILHSDFLFEHLFLMTASVHIFVLALFFVILQESTRQLWFPKKKKQIKLVRKIVVKK